MFEKVNPMHPDKLADRIAGALVDKAYEKEENVSFYLSGDKGVKFFDENQRGSVPRIGGQNDK